MVWFVLMHLVGFIVDLISGACGKAEEKDLQIAVLWHQVRLLPRRAPRPPRLSRWEQLTLAALTARLVRLAHRPRSQLAQILLLVPPETVLTWHRELIRRKWTYRRQPARGRPAVGTEVEALILRLAAENPRWGYGRRQGSWPSSATRSAARRSAMSSSAATSRRRRDAAGAPVPGGSSSRSTATPCWPATSSPSRRCS